MVLDGYPTSLGNIRMSIFSHKGPNPYAPMTFAPIALGDVVNAVEAGMKKFDEVTGDFSDSGTYYVRAVQTAGHPSNNKSGAISPTWRLAWYVTATGLQAGAIDLSAEIIRLTAFGPV